VAGQEERSEQEKLNEKSGRQVEAPEKKKKEKEATGDLKGGKRWGRGAEVPVIEPIDIVLTKQQQHR